MNILRPRLHLKHHEFQLRQDMEIDLEYAKEPIGETAVEVAVRYGNKSNPVKHIMHREIGGRTVDRVAQDFKFRFR